MLARMTSRLLPLGVVAAVLLAFAPAPHAFSEPFTIPGTEFRDIQPATELLYQNQEGEDEGLPDTWVALTDDAEGDQFLLFDLRKRVYL